MCVTSNAQRSFRCWAIHCFRAGAQNRPFTVPAHDLVHRRPAEVVVEVVRAGDGALFQAPMSFRHRGAGPPWRVTGQGRRVEIPGEFLIQAGLIPFDDHEIVATLGHNLAG